MEIRRSTKHISYEDGLRNAGIVLCLFAGACILGFAVISAGATSTTQTFAIGGFVIALLAGAIAFILEIPMIGIVRYAFIGSFFFKGDLNLFKINEVEDPSGLNISLTLVMGMILFVYELNNGKSREHVFPPVFKFFAAALFVCAAASVANIALSVASPAGEACNTPRAPALNRETPPAAIPRTAVHAWPSPPWSAWPPAPATEISARRLNIPSRSV